MKDQTTTRATDALANERTFLAYLRTALSFVAFGFVIARFSLFEREISIVTHVTAPSKHVSTTFGMAMAITGIVVGLYGGFRYIATDAALRRNRTEAMPPSAAIIGSLVVAAIGLIVAINLFSFR